MKVSQIIGKKTIDLNVDIGEGFAYDRDLLSFASSANVCCGVHAGSEDLSRETVALCHVAASPGRRLIPATRIESRWGEFRCVPAKSARISKAFSSRSDCLVEYGAAGVRQAARSVL